MKRYFIYLSYNGKNYCGWQIQPNGNTVQETIEKALSTLLQIPTQIVGAGRTDSGVHAREMVAHFDCGTNILDTSSLAYRLNNMLPKDIAIHKIIQVNSQAHARFDAVSRLYKYYLTTQKDPFLYDLKYKIHGNLDLEKMNAAAAILLEYKDFTSFSKLHTDVKTNNCILMHALWTKSENNYVFTIKADRFLRNMVRSIVGTLIQVGTGKIDIDGLKMIVEAKDRSKAGSSVPGCGLYLESIEYKKEVFDIVSE